MGILILVISIGVVFNGTDEVIFKNVPIDTDIKTFKDTIVCKYDHYAERIILEFCHGAQNDANKYTILKTDKAVTPITEQSFKHIKFKFYTSNGYEFDKDHEKFTNPIVNDFRYFSKR